MGKMTLLIAGATGFLGSHLLKKLIKEKYEVIVLKRSFSDVYRIKDCFDFVKIYDVDNVSLSKIFEENHIDVVINCVTCYGRNNEKITKIVDTNLVFSLKLLETAISFNTDTFFNTDTLLYKYLNQYSLSKKQFVEWLKYFSAKIKVINLKIEHMYGPNDDKSKFVTWLIKQLLNNIEEIELTSGEQKRDFIYIDDVVDVYLSFLKNIAHFKGFNEFDVGTGNQIKLKDFILKIYEEVGKVKNISSKLNFGAKKYREGEFMEIKENVAPLYNLGWKPQYKMEEAIKKTIESCIDDE